MAKHAQPLSSLQVDNILKLKPVEQLPKIDIVIPLGPSDRDREKMFPLSFYVPKPLVPVGTKPMILHIMEQISEIEKYVEKVFLLIQKHRGNNDSLIVESYLRALNELPICKKFIFKENNGNRMCDLISQLDFKSNYFLIHFDDILLQKKSGLLENLIEFHIKQEKINGKLYGTLAYSKQYPLEIGLIKQSTTKDRMNTLEEKSPWTLGNLIHKIGTNFEEVCINMAISFFNKKILSYLKNKNSNFYANVGKLKKDQIAIFEHEGKWYHIDSIHELYEQHIHNFADWRE